MRIRFTSSRQIPGGRCFAKGEVVDASDVPTPYLAGFMACGAAVNDEPPEVVIDFDSPLAATEPTKDDEPTASTEIDQ